MRQVVFRNPDKMEIDTGHGEYDAVVGALGPGNRIDGGQHSTYVRAHNTPTLPTGAPCQPGAMRDFDLKPFGKLPAGVLHCLHEHGCDEDLILYQFHHLSDRRDSWGERVVVTHGYVITRTHEHDHELVAKFYTGPTKKSIGVVDVAAEYVSNAPGAPELAHLTSIAAHPRLRPSHLAERAATARG